MQAVHLHIGLAKTGTTAVQNHLKSVREELAAAGVCYPSTGMPPNKPSHVTIALECQKPFTSPFDDLATLRASFGAEIAGFERAIVSSEGFQNITDLRRTSFFFMREEQPYPLHTVCCVREYLDLMRSTYAQYVQSSSITSTFDEFCARLAHFDLARFLDRWERISDSVTILNYETGVVPAFFRVAEISEHYVDADTRNANPTIAGNLLAFKLRLNALVPHENQFYNGLHRLALQDPRYRGPFRIGKAQAERLRSADNGYNRTFAKHCGDIGLRDFEDGRPLIEPEHWASDLERFLSDRAFEAVRDIRALRELPVAALA